MAACTLPRPKTRYGPCDPDGRCNHVDCCATITMAKKKCRICKVDIGYDTRFYSEDPENHSLVHARCLEDEIENQRRLPS